MAGQPEPLHIQVRVDLMKHRRFAELLALLDDVDELNQLGELVKKHVVKSCLEQLWSSAMERENEEGDLTGHSAAAIALVTDWPYRSHRETWMNALIGSGFLEQTDAGRLLIHHWDEFSGKYFAKRAEARERMAALRAERSTNVQRTFDEHSPGPESKGANGARTFLRAKTGEVKNVENVRTEEEIPGLTQAHARTRAREETPDFEVEDDDFLASAKDEPLPGVDAEDADLGPFPADDADVPGVIVKLQPLDEQVRRKEYPATGDELARAKRFWKTEYEKVGAEQAFYTSWTRAMAWPEQQDANGRKRQPLSDRALNEWLSRDFDRAKESGLPDEVARVARNGRVISAQEMAQFDAFERAEIRVGRSA
ncbi:MAG TPA: hypothetical protein VGJ60_06920 [Chloroflexota bacterium]|jgi:hypothetical protein